MKTFIINMIQKVKKVPMNMIQRVVLAAVIVLLAVRIAFFPFGYNSQDEEFQMFVTVVVGGILFFLFRDKKDK